MSATLAGPRGEPDEDPALEADVLIVGLGPVGALLAVLLGCAGVRVCCLERAQHPYELPRAVATDDEVLRTLESGGVLGSIDLVEHERSTFTTAAGRTLTLMEFGRGPSGHAGLATFHQGQVEAALAERLSGIDSVRICRGWDFECLEQDENGVSAWARPVDGGRARRMRARYLVGCDGAHSPVRIAAGIPFGGSSFAQPWLVLDARVAHRPPGGQWPGFTGDPAMPVVSVPIDAHRHRWEFLLTPGAPVPPARVVLENLFDMDKIEIEREVVYTFQARMAERWREGRVLLAGDAAHVMPPFAGQGLSSGWRDAHNLAWKLAAVIGGADPVLLDSYEHERCPHVRRMSRLARTLGAIVQARRPRAARLRDALLLAIDRSPLLGPWIRSGALRPPMRVRRGAIGTGGGELYPTDAGLPEGWALVGDPPAELAARLPVCAGEPGWLASRNARYATLRPDRIVFSLDSPPPPEALAPAGAPR